MAGYLGGIARRLAPGGREPPLLPAVAPWARDPMPGPDRAAAPVPSTTAIERPVAAPVSLAQARKWPEDVAAPTVAPAPVAAREAVAPVARVATPERGEPAAAPLAPAPAVVAPVLATPGAPPDEVARPAATVPLILAERARASAPTVARGEPAPNDPAAPVVRIGTIEVVVAPPTPGPSRPARPAPPPVEPSRSSLARGYSSLLELRLAR